MNPRTKVVDTKSTTPAEFLSGSNQAPSLPPKEAAAAASEPVPEKSDIVEAQVESPASPGATPPNPDPFVVIWKSPGGSSSIRAMEVPGGCIVQRAWLTGVTPSLAVSGALCFVPKVKIEGGKLVEA